MPEMPPTKHASPHLLAEALHRLSTPIVIIDENRHIQFCNASAQQLLSTQSSISNENNRLIIRSLGVQHRLDEFLQAREEDSRQPMQKALGLRVPRQGQMRDWMLSVYPIQHEARSESSAKRSYLIQLIGRIWPRPVAMDHIAKSFDLSAAELAVLRELCRGRTVLSTARSRGLSPETVRTHLKRIFRKCNVNTRAELMALLVRLLTFSPL